MVWKTIIFFSLVVFLSPSLVTCNGQKAAPLITQQPIDTQVVRNEPVTLDCRATGSPPPLIEWYKDGEMVQTSDPTSHKLLLPDGSLFFLSAKMNRKEQDGGTYWCVASNAHGVVRSINVTLSIAYMKDEFKIEPKDTEVLIGDDVILECSPPRGIPSPIVKWKKDGENLDLTSDKRFKIDEKGSLILYDAQKSDEGRYQCSAENLAALKTTKPIKLQVTEYPYFITKPKNQSVISGQDVLLECQSGGDPHPDIEWTKKESPIDQKRVKIINGKGIRILDVRPEDSGTYVCKAKNLAGFVMTQAVLRVSEPPVIVKKPEKHIQRPHGKSQISLNCQIRGNPEPIVMWAKEGDSHLIFPGHFYDSGAKNLRVSSTHNSLIIGGADVEDSGHYVCIGLNEVRSVMTRTHLLIYDDVDTGNAKNTRIYQQESSNAVRLTSARLALEASSTHIVSSYAVTSTSIKLTWTFSTNEPKFVSGFRIWFKRARSPLSSFKFVEISHPDVSSFVLNRLQEFTDYHIFVQPFYKDIIGMPSRLVKVQTHQDVPSQAPVLVESRLINSSTIFLAWLRLNEDESNGPLEGYEILIQGNGTSVNNTVSSDINEVTLYVKGMIPHRIYTIQIAALNEKGKGPFSAPLEIELDPLLYDMDPFGGANANPVLKGQDVIKLSWIIGIVAMLSFILIVLSAFFVYKKKLNEGRKPLRYLETSTDEFHHCHLARSVQDHHKETDALWMDQNHYQRWSGTKVDQEQESNSSEKKLLPQSHSNSNSDTEYTYVENNRHNVSGFTTSSGASRFRTQDSPEPYASTDILKNVDNQLYLKPRLPAVTNPYSSPVFVSKRYANPNPELRSSSDFKSRNVRNNFSCDDLRSSRRARYGNPNLMDIIPPPPSHPPPPPSVYGMSQESVISPKYLFQHPMYQSTQRQLSNIDKKPQNWSLHRVQPSEVQPLDPNSHAEEFQRLLPLSRPVPEENSYLDNELQIFNDAITKFSQDVLKSEENVFDGDNEDNSSLEGENK